MHRPGSETLRLAVASLIVACSYPAFVSAQSSPTNAASAPDAGGGVLEEVTVTASRMSRALSEIPTAVSVLDARSIDQQIGLSTDLLRALDVTVPGLNVSAGGRSQCLTNIRGRTPSFQINGVPANQDLRPSNCNSAFQLSPFAVERVEVVRGATALFGAGAPGGIVNLITRRAASADLEVDLVAQTGANTSSASDTWHSDLYLGAGQKLDRFDYYLGFGYQDYQASRDPNGDFIPATEFDSLALNGSAGYEINDGWRARLTATWYEEDPGQEYNVDGADVAAGVKFPDVIPIESNPFRNQSFDRQSTLALSLEGDELLSHQFAASVFYQEQEFRQRANFQDFNGGDPDFFNDNRENSTTGLRLTLARTYDVGSGLDMRYGVDLQRARLLRLLLDSADPSIITGFIAPEVILDTIGLFVQADYRVDRIRFTGGLRQEFYTGEIGDKYANRGLPGTGTPGDFDDADLALYNAGIVFDLRDDFQLYASFNQGAELTQLGRAARRATDPGLISPEPAVSDQYEIGARGTLGPIELTAAAFYSESDAASLVQPDPSCAGQSFCPLIPLRVPQKVWGIEGTLAWPVSPTVDLGGVFTWQEGEIFDEDVGDYIPFGSDTVSPTRFTLYTDWQAMDALALRLQATYIMSTDFFSPAEQQLGLVETDSVFTTDLSANYELRRGTVGVGITNLFDEEYQNVTLAAGGFTPTLAEGRRVTMSYRVRF
jgi:iron complex outermembrane receptor protein